MTTTTTKEHTVTDHAGAREAHDFFRTSELAASQEAEDAARQARKAADQDEEEEGPIRYPAEGSARVGNPYPLVRSPWG